MDNKKLSEITIDIINLNQQYFNNEITAKHLVNKIDIITKELSPEDLLTLGCALTTIYEQTERTCKK